MVISRVRLMGLPGQELRRKMPSPAPPAPALPSGRSAIRQPVNAELIAPMSIGALYVSSPGVCAIRAYSGIASSPQGLFPGLSRIGVRVVGVRGDGAEISGAQVIDAPERLELIRVRLIRTHVAIAGRLSDGAAQP